MDAVAAAALGPGGASIGAGGAAFDARGAAMMLLPCPWCGPRNVSEFHYAGEFRHRPDPATTTPATWRAYLYLAENPRGPVLETWLHRMGCRRYFCAERDTATNEVMSVRPVGEPDGKAR